MDILHFWLKLLTTGFILSVCQAVNCNWKTQYEHDGICCNACPSGEYPKELCNNTKQTVCENCSASGTSNTRCSCGSTPLCVNSDCSSCQSRPRCKQGEELRRKGNFLFDYVCEPCISAMYNNDEDGTCEPIAECRKYGLSVLFAGNITHNARCGWQSDANHTIYKAMAMCLAMTCLSVVVLLIDVCTRRFKRKKRTNKHHLTHSVDCACKLSKEEMGDKRKPQINDILLEVSTQQDDV